MGKALAWSRGSEPPERRTGKRPETDIRSFSPIEPVSTLDEALTIEGLSQHDYIAGGPRCPDRDRHRPPRRHHDHQGSQRDRSEDTRLHRRGTVNHLTSRLACAIG